jgi:hypothetical protein
MANQKSKTGRRRAARAPVIEAEVTEIIEDAEKAAEDAAESVDNEGEKTQGTPSQDQKTSAVDRGDDATGSVKKSDSGIWMKTAGIAALLAGVGVGGAWLYRDYGSAYFPTPAAQQQSVDINAMTSRVGALEAAVNEASEREKKLRAEIDQMHKAVGDANAKIGAVDVGAALQAAEAANAKASALEQKADAASAAAQAAGDAATQASKGVSAANQAIAEVRTAIAEAAKAVPVTDEQSSEALKAAQMQISNLNLKVDDAIKRLEAEAKTTSGGGGQIEALSAAVAALQANVKQLSDAQTGLSDMAQKSQAAGEQTAALAGALTQLRQKLISGAPFAEPLAVIAKDLPGDPSAKTLSGIADTGVVTVEKLISTFGRVSYQISTAAASGEEKDKTSEKTQSGLLARIQKRLGQIVKIRPAGTTDWRGIVTRMSAEAGRGDLAAMVRHLDGISAKPPEALGTWLVQARERLAADAAFGELSVNVMARAAASGKTGG